jgi:para-aminobenzoate synthetase component 1
MKWGIEQLPRVSSLFMEEIDLGLPFELAAARFAEDPGTVLLLSGTSPAGGCARYNILAIQPWLELKVRGEALALKVDNESFDLDGDPFTFLGELLDHLKLDHLHLDGAKEELPVCAGLFGYFSYDLKDRIENLPRTCGDVHLPEICLVAPSILLVQDRISQKTFLSIPILSNCKETPNAYVSARKQAFLKQLGQAWAKRFFSSDPRGFKSSFTKKEYIRAVEKITHYLTAGDIYQANLSQRFETGFSGDSYSLFMELFKRNPASFFSYIHAGDHKIVSTSPERFIKLAGTRVETRPIKGTIARGDTPAQDWENGQHLAHSIKDDAELTMIVDLMRNDLSRVTRQGSVVVSEHKRLEPYDNVFHLVSIVEGELETGKTAVDLLRATFPGGSITGCSKIRSMEIIDELEPVKRHVYTGAIGYVSFHNTMDLSIAIRTATIVDETLFFSVGGGIVYDSDPELEFQETLDKGKTLMETLSAVSAGDAFHHPKAWVDGKMVDQDRAMVSATSQGFQYGAGLFETIRVDEGTPLRLGAHLQRMNGAWTSLFKGLPPDITWEHVIDLLIQENGYTDQICAVKLMVSRDEQANGKQTFVAAFARPYVHRLVLSGKTGLDLVTFPFPRVTPLADHKTQNYLYYERAGVYAKDHGGDEAMILNPDLTISETNTGNIFMVIGEELVVPVSDHVLPGVTLMAVLNGFARQGGGVLRKKISAKEIISYPNILVTNALMGAVRVVHIDGQKIAHDAGVCERMNLLLTG